MALELTNIDHAYRPDLALKLAYKRLQFSLTQSLSAITAAMHPNGTFATVITLPVRVLPSAQRFRRRLHEMFGSVSQTRTVWRNIPLARFYICRGPFARPWTAPRHRAAAALAPVNRTAASR